MKFYIAFIAGLTISFTPGFGQKFKNIKIHVQGPVVQVNYEMDGFEYGQDYEVHLYGSYNEFSQPLQNVTGDVGQKVKGDGNVKKIIWNAGTELGIYQKDISVELRGKLYVPFLKLTTPLLKKHFKKGKTYVIQWEGGEQTNQLDFELIKDDAVKTTDKKIPNNRNYSWLVPKNLKPGKDYSFKISNSNNGLDYLVTDDFTVIRKIPLAVFIAPLAVGAGFIACQLLHICGSENVPAGETGIPRPLSPPTQ
jgi:hypothetical protein